MINRDRIYNADLIFAVIITLAFVAALAQAVRWPMEASLFPIIVCSVGLLLAVLQIASHRSAGKQEKPAAEAGTPRGKEFAASLWIVGIFVLTVVTGYQWGLPLSMLLYFKFESKLNLPFSVLLAALCWGAIYAWITVLHLSLYEGLLWSLIPSA
ncbi:MAG: hypothetical protein M1358_19955 [Chloroflexi bacterium]|nr:hypothetical protein [Chloroflexota bacterium]